MLFQRKVDRAMEHAARRARERAEADEVPEEPALHRELEKGDVAAMLISALAVLLPAGLLVLLVLALVAFLPLLGG